VSPAASVSSVSGVGATNPVPTDSRLVHPPARASAETRGLKKVPYSLWKSTFWLQIDIDILLRAGRDVDLRARRNVARLDDRELDVTCRTRDHDHTGRIRLMGRPGDQHFRRFNRLVAACTCTRIVPDWLCATSVAA
jgi:hypothetical protein